MAGAELKVELDSKAAQRALNKLMRKTSDARAVMKLIGEHMLNSTKDNFSNESAPDGTAWSPLAPATIAGRLDKGYNASGILRASGTMAGGINYRASSSSVSIGTNAIQAAIHQWGGKAGRGHSVIIPARPYLGVGPDDETAIVEIVEDYLIDH